MAGEVIAGKLRYVYIAAAGIASDGTATWTRLGKLQGQGLNSSRDTYEVKEQESDYATILTGHQTKEGSLTISFRPGNTAFEALKDAYNGNTPIGIGFCDQDKTTSGAETWQANVRITQFNEPRGHGDTTVELQVKPDTNSVYAPALAVTA